MNAGASQNYLAISRSSSASKLSRFFGDDFFLGDNNFCFYAEVNFWDFVRNDNSKKGTTAWLNETRFDPKKKSSPKNLDNFDALDEREIAR
jgi:hypothetical protein